MFIVIWLSAAHMEVTLADSCVSICVPVFAKAAGRLTTAHHTGCQPLLNA